MLFIALALALALVAWPLAARADAAGLAPTCGLALAEEAYRQAFAGTISLDDTYLPIVTIQIVGAGHPATTVRQGVAAIVKDGDELATAALADLLRTSCS
jgi:hypothetical protein